jgi:hypothetical protein
MLVMLVPQLIKYIIPERRPMALGLKCTSEKAMLIKVLFTFLPL